MIEELIRQITRLQRQVDGLVKPEVSRWQTWTPTVTQSGAVTVTVNSARYVVIGDTVIVRIYITTTSAGTAGSAISIQGAPFAPSHTANVSVIGTAIIERVTAGVEIQGALVAVGVADFRVITDGVTSWAGITPNFALANGDHISFQATYEH